MRFVSETFYVCQLAICLMLISGCDNKAVKSVKNKPVEITKLQELGEIHFPKPDPKVPEEWPEKLILYRKSEIPEEEDAKDLYDSNYIRGWNYVIDQYSTGLVLPFRCQTGYEQEAEWAGIADCTKVIEKLENQHGRSKLADFLKNSRQSSSIVF